MRLPPNQEQINEWADSPVTQYLGYLIESELTAYEDFEVFSPGNPQKTQEALLKMIAEVSVFQWMQEALKGDFSEFSGEDEVEPE